MISLNHFKKTFQRSHQVIIKIPVKKIHLLKNHTDEYVSGNGEHKDTL